MSSSPRIGSWFASASTVFFTRAFFFSTWVSRGPEVQQALGINTAEMGLLSMLYPAGGLAGVLFARALVRRFSSRIVTASAYILLAAGFSVLGLAVTAGNFALSAVCLFVMGLPMAISDYVGNYEGAEVDKASKRSLFPAIHGAFGVGMLLGAYVTGWLIDQGVSIAVSFAGVAAFVCIASFIASRGFPKRETGDGEGAAKAEKVPARKIWTERRSLILAVVGFSFIMAEMSAGTWVPIALANNGFTGTEAASALGIFWIVITAARLLGGYLIDLIGRFRTVLFSALTTAAGMVIFMTSEANGLPYLGLILWGLGMALGFPMVVASMGDDEKLAPARVNMIITVVYISSISVGPALGALGQAAGIYVAFAIPLVMMVVSAILSPITKPEVAK